MYVLGHSDYYERTYYYVTIPAGETIVPFSIQIYDDDRIEGLETFYIYIYPSLPYNNIYQGSTTGTTITILDDDCEHFVVLWAYTYIHNMHVKEVPRVMVQVHK